MAPEPSVFSVEEQTEIIIIWVQQNFSYTQTAAVFNARHPNRNPCTYRNVSALIGWLKVNLLFSFSQFVTY